jgi:hypothetical protein
MRHVILYARIYENRKPSANALDNLPAYKIDLS